MLVLSYLPTGAVAQDLASCLDQEKLAESGDFDFDFGWVQKKTTDIDSRDTSPIALKALGELSERVSQLGPTLVIAMIPPRIAGAPLGSEHLQAAAEGWRSAYAKALSELDSVGVRAADLSRIYDGRNPEEIQRHLDHHLTGYGTWLAGAEIASEISGQPKNFETMVGTIEALPRHAFTYNPSNWHQNLFLETCSPADFKPDDFTFVPPEHTDDAANSLFGDVPSKGAILVGTSYSTSSEGALGAAIDTLFPLGADNFAVNAGGHLTSLGLVLSNQLDKLENASWLIWESEWRAPLSEKTALGALMLVKGAQLGTCNPTAPLLATGELHLDADGRATLPIPGVLEDILTLDVPGAMQDQLLIHYHMADGSENKAAITSNFTFVNGGPSDVRHIQLGILDQDWWGTENPVASIELEYDPQGERVDTIEYTACWSMN